MKHFWKEKYITENWAAYFGSTSEFRIGITLGLANDLYLDRWILGISKF
jgi:hypothetical protein